MLLPSQWPRGIDVLGRYHRWNTRRCVPGLRSAIEKLAAESADVTCFDIAARAYLERYAICAPVHPGRGALQRLARRYVRHFRREMVRERQYLEAAAKWALMAAGAAP